MRENEKKCYDLIHLDQMSAGNVKTTLKTMIDNLYWSFYILKPWHFIVLQYAIRSKPYCNTYCTRSYCNILQYKNIVTALEFTPQSTQSYTVSGFYAPTTKVGGHIDLHSSVRPYVRTFVRPYVPKFCVTRNSKTIWPTFMKLHGSVTDHVNLCTSIFWFPSLLPKMSYLPLNCKK